MKIPLEGIELLYADGQTVMKKLKISFRNFADASENFISLNKMKKNQIILTTEASVRQILVRTFNPKIMKVDRKGPVCTLFKT
jgi:hypothetical protein